MAKIHPEYRNGELYGYRADVGKQPNGKRLKPFFKTLKEAETFITNYRQDATTSTVVIERKAEFLHCFERCKEMGVTLHDVVEFYAKHGAMKSNPTVAEVARLLIDAKRKADRKETYLVSISKHLDRFIAHVGDTTLIRDISSGTIEQFVSKHFNDANAVTKLNVYRNLSVLFNFAIKQSFVGINPVLKLEKPHAKFKAPKVLSPEDFTTLLNRCYQKKWYDRLTVFVLVGFCGIRTEEASQLKWSDIDLTAGKVMVPAEVAKKAAFRRNVIPPNALAWLKAIEDKRRTGLIIGDNWVSLLRTAVKYAHINHTHNCLRHSFCSYSLESGVPLADVVANMGHGGSPAMIHSHYRNIVEKDVAIKWWEIMPPV